MSQYRGSHQLGSGSIESGKVVEISQRVHHRVDGDHESWESRPVVSARIARRIERANRLKLGLNIALGILAVSAVLLMVGIHQEMNELTQMQTETAALIDQASKDKQGIMSGAYELYNSAVTYKDEAQSLLDQANSVLDQVEQYTWITEDNIFTYSLRNQSYLTQDALNAAFENHPEMQAMTQSIIAHSMENNVNPIALSSIIALETGWGRSDVCKNRNNVAGLVAQSGNYMQFDSLDESIGYLAQLLNKNYLDPDGRFYHGDTLEGVSQSYCTTEGWDTEVGKIMIGLQREVDTYNGKPVED